MPLHVDYDKTALINQRDGVLRQAAQMRDKGKQFIEMANDHQKKVHELQDLIDQCERQEKASRE